MIDIFFVNLKRMKKAYYILFMIFCGFLLNPINSYGCNSSKETTITKSCCELKKDLQIDAKAEKSCCKNSKSEEKSCDGSCNNSNCTFASVFSSIIPIFSFKINDTIEKIVSKKVNFFYLEKNISTHYFSIWCPPKIS